MLESLDTMAMQQLKQAHSEANPVQVPNDAIDILHRNIWHPVYEDIASAVRFLIERLQSDSVQDKDELLLLLAYVARGNSYADTQAHLEQEQPECQEHLSPQERAWVRNAHNAVREGVDVYLDLLKHHEPAVRTCAAYTLACFREDACNIIPTLCTCIDTEEDQLAKSSMLLSLGTLAEYDPVLPKIRMRNRQRARRDSAIVCRSSRGASLPAPLLLWGWRVGPSLLSEVIQGEASDLIKLTASMALARLARDNTPAEAVRVLVDTLIEPAATEDLYIELPWVSTDVVGDTSSVLYALGPCAAHIAIPMLIEALRTAASHSSLRVVDALLYLAFNGERVNTDVTGQTLTEEQRLVLTTIANSSSAWVLNIINGHQN